MLHRPLLSPALCLSAGPLRAPEHVVSRVEGEGLRSLDDCFSRGRFAKMMAGNYMKILVVFVGSDFMNVLRIGHRSCM